MITEKTKRRLQELEDSMAAHEGPRMTIRVRFIAAEDGRPAGAVGEELTFELSGAANRFARTQEEQSI